MIRCKAEVDERNDAYRDREETRRGRPPIIRVGFDDLLRRERRRWETLTHPDELQALTDHVRPRLLAGGMPRFIEWIEMHHGNAFARQGGLPVGRPRLYVA